MKLEDAAMLLVPLGAWAMWEVAQALNYAFCPWCSFLP